MAGNTGGSYGGGVYNTGDLTLNDQASITGNHFWQRGGGVYNGVSASTAVVMSGSSSISGNRSRNGGGLYNTGTVTMSGSSSITNNLASNAGGGMMFEGTLFGVVDGGNVRDNSPDNIHPCFEASCP